VFPYWQPFVASILREHGTQRPSIYEILEVVHRIRGTRSRFSYSIPEKQPLSPRPTTSSSPSNALEELVTFRSQQSTPGTRNTGTQARDKVLEAISPMRRGRPIRGTSRSPSPNKEKARDRWDGEFNANFGAEEDQAWRAAAKIPIIRGHKSGVVSSDAWKIKAPITLSDDWEKKADSQSTPRFESDFSIKGFGDSFDVVPPAPLTLPSDSHKLIPNSNPIPNRSTPPMGSPVASPDLVRLGAPRTFKSKDAFEGLGFSQKPPPPTLGEVRKARTGLTLPLEQSFTPRRLSPQPPASPQPLSLPPPPPLQSHPQDLTIEERFPSIEELDRRIFGNGRASPLPSPRTDVQSSKLPYFGGVASQDTSLPATRAPSNLSRGSTGGVRSTVDSRSSVNPSSGHAGYRSQNVTGTAMRDSKNPPSNTQEASSSVSVWPNEDISKSSSPGRFRPSRPSLTRKHRSSITVKQTSSQFDMAVDPSTPGGSFSRPLADPAPSSQAQDWLTGDEEEHASRILSRLSTDATSTTPDGDDNYGAPVLRESPRKRASFFEKSPHLIAEPLEGDVEQSDLLPPPVLSPRPTSPVSTQHKVSSSITSRRKPPPLVDTEPPPIKATSKGGGLTDNWSPITTETPIPSTTKKGRKPSLTSDSGDDEGPEDVSGYGSLRGKTSIRVDLQEKKANTAEKSKRRQSSVHDLVDLWGGSSLLDKDKERGSKVDSAPKEQKRRSVIWPSATTVATAASSAGFPRSSSPPPMLGSSLAPPEKSNVHSSSNDANKHRKSPVSTAFSPPLQKSTSSTSSGQSHSRSRPQSMFLFPSSKSATDSCELPSPGPEMPPEGMRTISASRRTSISNMVQRYEGMGGVGGYAGVPPAPTKHLGLKLPTSDNSTGVGSSNTRYMRISPNNSPIKVLGGVGSLPVPDSDDAYDGRGSRRTSPIDRTSPRRSPVEYVRKKSLPAPGTSQTPDPTTIKSTTWDNSSSSEDPKSPSPERPYAGVSRLIDQWQKKAEESNTNDGRKGAMATKRHAVVNGGAR
jgi:AP2-associated kinase